MTVFRTGRQDDAASQEGFILKGDLLDVAFKIQRVGILVAHLRAELFGLLTHLVHEVRTHDALGETREVLDLGRVHQSTASRKRTSDNNGLKTRASSVNSCRVPRGARTDNNDVMDVFRHGVSYGQVAVTSLTAR